MVLRTGYLVYSQLFKVIPSVVDLGERWMNNEQVWKCIIMPWDLGHTGPVQAVGTDELVNEQLSRARSGERDDVAHFGAVGQDVYQRDKRARRPNIRLGQDAVNAERMLKLQRSRRRHQGHLTELNNKISVILHDTYNVDSVKELLELFNRQWERFNLVHNEVLLFADNDHSTVASAMHAYKEQFARKTELLNKVSQY
jgi:hypothetical protein